MFYPSAIGFLAVVLLHTAFKIGTPDALPAIASGLHYCVLGGLIVCGHGLTKNGLKSVLRVSVVAGTLSAGLCIAQALGWQGVPQVAPPAGVFLNRNLLAEYLAVTIPAGAYLGGWWIACNCVMGAAIGLTGCRGAILAVLVAGFAVGMARRRLGRMAVAGILMAACGVGWWVRTYPDLAGFAVRERLSMWDCTLRMIFEHPYGVGPEGWVRLLPVYDTMQVSTGAFGGPRTPHNDFLFITAEYGLPAIIFLASGMMALWQRLIGQIQADNKEGLLAGWCCAVFIILACFGFPAQNGAALFLPCLLAGYSTSGCKWFD